MIALRRRRTGLNGKIRATVLKQAHLDLRDVYCAAVVAARTFSIKGQSDLSAEAMTFACDATRMRKAIEDLEVVPGGER